MRCPQTESFVWKAEIRQQQEDMRCERLKQSSRGKKRCELLWHTSDTLAVDAHVSVANSPKTKQQNVQIHSERANRKKAQREKKHAHKHRRAVCFSENSQTMNTHLVSAMRKVMPRFLMCDFLRFFSLLYFCPCFLFRFFSSSCLLRVFIWNSEKNQMSAWIVWVYAIRNRSHRILNVPRC